MAMPKQNQGLPIHPYAEVFPLHDGPPLWELRDDIAAHGLRDKITVYQDMVLDGRRRQAACIAKGIDPKYVKFKGTDAEALAFVVSKNLKRRHLGEAERAMAAAKVANLDKGRPKINTAGAGISQDEAAEMLNVSSDAVGRAKKIQDKGTQNLQQAVQDGTVSLSDAATVADKPAPVQDKAVEDVKKGKAKTAKQAVGQPEANGRAAEPQRDKHGHFITAHTADAFGNLAKFEALDALVRQLQKGIDELSTLPGGEQLRRFLQPTGSEGRTLNKSEHLNALKRDLRFTRPNSVCPYCVGKGKKDCKGCSGTGWITETTWKDTEESIRARLES